MLGSGWRAGSPGRQPQGPRETRGGLALPALPEPDRERRQGASCPSPRKRKECRRRQNTQAGGERRQEHGPPGLDLGRLATQNSAAGTGRPGAGRGAAGRGGAGRPGPESAPPRRGSRKQRGGRSASAPPSGAPSPRPASGHGGCAPPAARARGASAGAAPPALAAEPPGPGERLPAAPGTPGARLLAAGEAPTVCGRADGREARGARGTGAAADALGVAGEVGGAVWPGQGVCGAGCTSRAESWAGAGVTPPRGRTTWGRRPRRGPAGSRRAGSPGGGGAFGRPRGAAATRARTLPRRGPRRSPAACGAGGPSEGVAPGLSGTVAAGARGRGDARREAQPAGWAAGAPRPTAPGRGSRGEWTTPPCPPDAHPRAPAVWGRKAAVRGAHPRSAPGGPSVFSALPPTPAPPTALTRGGSAQYLSQRM